MSKAFLIAAFFISILYLPSWAALFIAILYLAEGGDAFVVVFGGMILDFLFGAPIANLHGFSFVYTLLMLCIGFTAFYLRKTLFE